MSKKNSYLIEIGGRKCTICSLRIGRFEMLPDKDEAGHY